MRSHDGVLIVETTEAIDGIHRVYNFEVEKTHTYYAGDDDAWVHNSCVPEFTKAMLGQSRVIAKGRDIRKVDELVNKFGGKARDWVKKSTVDPASGREIHWYEAPGIGKVGQKWAGTPDPF